MKNFLLLVTGIIVGAIVTGSSTYFIYNTYLKDIAIPANIEDVGIEAEIPTDPIAFRPTEENIQVPIPRAVSSQAYQNLLEEVVNSVNKITNNNNSVLVPTMLSLQKKGLTGEWGNVFDEATNAKIALNENLILAESVGVKLGELRSENSAKTLDAVLKKNTDNFIQAGSRFIESYTDYSMTLSKFLTGQSPTKALADELNSKILDMTPKNQTFQDETTVLFTQIIQMNKKVSATQDTEINNTNTTGVQKK